MRMKTNGMKRVVSFVLICLMAVNMVFAAGDDLGIGEYLGKIRSFFLAIGGGLLVISLGIWAIKTFITRDISPKDWKAIGVMAVGGVVLILAPTIISYLIPDLDVSGLS